MAGGTNGDEDDIISAINVTPLVDVILVLLIIFMVTARIIVSQGMPMDLPKAASGEEVQTIFSVELTADGLTVVDSERVENDEAVSRLAKTAKAKVPELRAVIRADNKHRARLNAMKVILGSIDYERRDPDLNYVPDDDIVISGARELELMRDRRLKSGEFVG